MPNAWKNGFDTNLWKPLVASPITHAVGVSMCSDKRNDISRNPFIYHINTNTNLNRQNIISNGSHTIVNPGLGGTFGAGVTLEFGPSRGLEGNITTGGTDSRIVTSTVITSVGANMLANRGGTGERGFKIRIIGKSVGKVEERWIVGNTPGTTPTIWLDTPLTFTPTTGDTYEILGGVVYMLGASTIATTSFRSMEVCTNALTSLATTNLPTISIDSAMVALDEQYVPYDHIPGIGFVKGAFQYDPSGDTGRVALTATASGASSLTGQATLGDSSLLANEYRNFQIRIVQDTTNPTAVGQRRIIASHTAGPSPVYTLGSAWTVTPSATAKYVIEYPNLILLRTSGATAHYVYNYNKENITNGTTTINANAWSATYFTAGTAVGAGCMIMPSYGIQPDPGKNARHSFIYFVRGGGTVNIDLLDISGGASGLNSSGIVYDGSNTFTTGACGDYAPADQEGKFFYINNYFASVTHLMLRFDVKNRVMSPYCPTVELQAGTAVVGKRMATYVWFRDTNEKYTNIVLQSHLSNRMYEITSLF